MPPVFSNDEGPPLGGPSSFEDEPHRGAWLQPRLLLVARGTRTGGAEATPVGSGAYASPATEPLWTVSPFDHDEKVARMFSTHPRLADRVSRLRGLAESTQ